MILSYLHSICRPDSELTDHSKIASFNGFDALLHALKPSLLAYFFACSECMLFVLQLSLLIEFATLAPFVSDGAGKNCIAGRIDRITRDGRISRARGDTCVSNAAR